MSVLPCFRTRINLVVCSLNKLFPIGRPWILKKTIGIKKGVYFTAG